MTIKVHVIAEPSSIAQEAELVVESISAGCVVAARVIPLPPGRLVSEYIHQGQQLAIREKAPQ